MMQNKAVLLLPHKELAKPSGYQSTKLTKNIQLSTIYGDYDSHIEKLRPGYQIIFNGINSRKVDAKHT